MTAPKRSPRVALYTFPEVAEWLGSSRQHVYDLVNSGELPYVNVATRRAGRTKKRIREDALEAFMDRRTAKAPLRRGRPPKAAAS